MDIGKIIDNLERDAIDDIETWQVWAADNPIAALEGADAAYYAAGMVKAIARIRAVGVTDADAIRAFITERLVRIASEPAMQTVSVGQNAVHAAEIRAWALLSDEMSR